MIQQLGLTPAPALGVTALANTRTWLRNTLYGAEPEAIAAGVWVVRGGLAEDDERLPDRGRRRRDRVRRRVRAQMTGAIRAAAARLGGIRRVVLGHADGDHRGGAAGLDAPVYCHPPERLAAEAPTPYRDYWDSEPAQGLGTAAVPAAAGAWDGGAVEIAGTLSRRAMRSPASGCSTSPATRRG